MMDAETMAVEKGSDGTDRERTLPGLGPRLGMERLRRVRERRRRERACREGAAKLDLVRTQFRRYEWFAARVDTDCSIEEYVSDLNRPPAGPGTWERALVALSLQDDSEARAYLRQWEPPAGDAALASFHQVCMLRSE